MVRAVYPGSFDPFHFGHLEIANRASKLFAEVVIAVYENPSKKLLFTTAERIDMVKDMLSHLSNISVVTYTGLTVDCARNTGSAVLIRGLRNATDFQFEHQLAWANNHLADKVETCCLFSKREFAYLSSTILKEVAALDGDYRAWTSPYVQRALRRAYFTDKEESGEGHVAEPDGKVVSRSESELSYRN